MAESRWQYMCIHFKVFLLYCICENICNKIWSKIKKKGGYVSHGALGVICNNESLKFTSKTKEVLYGD